MKTLEDAVKAVAGVDTIAFDPDSDPEEYQKLLDRAREKVKALEEQARLKYDCLRVEASMCMAVQGLIMIHVSKLMEEWVTKAITDQNAAFKLVYRIMFSSFFNGLITGIEMEKQDNWTTDEARQ